MFAFGGSWVSSYHVDVWEIALVVVMLGVLAVIAAPWIMRRRGAGSDWMQGQLLVTGVSPRPDDLTGEQFVTITGVINGPTVNEHVIYQRMAVDVDQWPTMSAALPGRLLAEEPRQLALRRATAADAAGSTGQRHLTPVSKLGFRGLIAGRI